MKNAAQATLAWVYVQRKDHPKAETELTKYLHLDPTQASTSLTLGGELLAQNQDHPEKLPLGLYQFARAATYDGQNSLPAAARKQALDYLTKTYTAYHGSKDGLDKLLAWPRTVRSRPRASASKAPGISRSRKPPQRRTSSRLTPIWGSGRPPSRIR